MLFFFWVNEAQRIRGHGEWPCSAPLVEGLYCITESIAWCDHGFACVSVDEVTRWVFEIEMNQIGFSCMFVEGLTGQSGTLCSLLSSRSVYTGKPPRS